MYAPPEYCELEPVYPGSLRVGPEEACRLAGNASTDPAFRKAGMGLFLGLLPIPQLKCITKELHCEGCQTFQCQHLEGCAAAVGYATVCYD